jgi:hypothetical protein
MGTAGFKNRDKNCRKKIQLFFRRLSASQISEHFLSEVKYVKFLCRKFAEQKNQFKKSCEIVSLKRLYKGRHCISHGREKLVLDTSVGMVFTQ